MRKHLSLTGSRRKNALLKNSLRYIPTAHKEIREEMRVVRDTGLSEGSRLVQSTFDDVEKMLAAASKQGTEATNNQDDNKIANLRDKMRRAKFADTVTRGAFTLVNLESNVGTLVSEALRYNSVPDNETAELLKVGIGKNA